MLISPAATFSSPATFMPSLWIAVRTMQVTQSWEAATSGRELCAHMMSL